MALIRIPTQDRTLTDVADLSAFLSKYGIFYERWDVAREVRDESQEAILEAYQPEVAALCARGGYQTADVINVTADTPGLDAMLNKFNKEHQHTEDEIRFIVKGRGIFHINPDPDPVFSIEVEAGDLINVPAGTRHWFDLCSDRCIRAIRLFIDKSGWTPHYLEGGVHAEFSPLCWGPSYLPRQTAAFEPAIDPTKATAGGAPSVAQ